MTRDIVWVDDQVKLCQNIYTNFMWGKDYERLRAEAEELEVIFKEFPMLIAYLIPLDELKVKVIMAYQIPFSMPSFIGSLREF